MKIFFVDSRSRPYDSTTYMESPLGGTQSAVSCLAKELAQAGHQVFVINGNSEPVETDGVRFLGLPCPATTFNEFDVVVPVSMPLAKTLREIGCNRPVVLWSHHADNQPVLNSLNNPEERNLYSGFAFVSEWQAKRYVARFNIPSQLTKVLKNAPSPPFFDHSPKSRWLKTGSPPVLGYTCTPYRGLDILLLAWPYIKNRIEGATLRVFSSMKIYGFDQRDNFSSLYELMKVFPEIDHVGALPQPKLAEAMSDIDIWSYPSIFPETSCISAMEAMISGTLLVSSDLGAIPETTAGFAHLNKADLSLMPGATATFYAEHLVNAVKQAEADPQATLSRIEKQMEFVRANYTWKQRAAEWVEWLNTVI